MHGSGVVKKSDQTSCQATRQQYEISYKTGAVINRKRAWLRFHGFKELAG